MAQIEKVCLQCKKHFIASRSDARFCSAICRSQYNWSLRAEKKQQEGDTIQEPGENVMDSILVELRQIKQILSSRSERVMTIDQVCDEFNISKPTFDRYHAEGIFKVYRFGRDRGSKGRGRKPYLLFSELIEALKSQGKPV